MLVVASLKLKLPNRFAVMQYYGSNIPTMFIPVC